MWQNKSHPSSNELIRHCLFCQIDEKTQRVGMECQKYQQELEAQRYSIFMQLIIVIYSYFIYLLLHVGLLKKHMRHKFKRKKE